MTETLGGAFTFPCFDCQAGAGEEHSENCGVWDGPPAEQISRDNPHFTGPTVVVRRWGADKLTDQQAAAGFLLAVRVATATHQWADYLLHVRAGWTFGGN